MKVEVAFPPNIDEIRKHFNLGESVVFCYGDTLYNPSGKEIPGDLMAHESVHERQQGGAPSAWWGRYLEDPQFRLEQELEAYAAQYHFMKSKLNARGLKEFLLQLSLDLSGHMYGKLITAGEAMSKIRNRAKEHADQKS